MTSITKRNLIRVEIVILSSVIAIFLCVVIWMFAMPSVYHRLALPDQRSMDGVYRSDCCRDIIIRDGFLYHGAGEGIPFKLERMKFGITGYVGRRFTPEGAMPSDEPVAVLFSEINGRRALTVPVGSSPNAEDQLFLLIDPK